MNKIAKIGVIATTAAVLGLASLSAIASRGEHEGSCEKGDRYERHGMMKEYRGDRQLDLTAEQVKTLMEARLLMRGNDRLKVGQVAQKDEQTYLVDILTVDDSLVRQIEVDKNQGFKHHWRGHDK